MGSTSLSLLEEAPLGSGTSPRLSDELTRCAGHYAAAVAELLLEQGLPVILISSCGPYDDPEEPYSDVQAGVSFTQSFQDRYGGSAGLQWEGDSGWCFYRVTDQLDYLEGARWLGAGLLPEPRRVAAFLDLVRLDPDEAGSTERPYYRTAGHGLPDLLERLRPHTLKTFAHNPRARFGFARTNAYVERVTAALTEPDSSPAVQVPLQRGELTALLHLLEYSEDLRNPYARRLAADITARVNTSTPASHVTDSAAREAARLQRLRNQQRGHDGPV